MEETKELQTVYKIFRTLIYVSLVVELIWGIMIKHYLLQIGQWILYK